MSSPLDEVTKLLAGLSLGQSCIKNLESLRILLAEVPTSELREYVPKIDLDRLFDCLNTSDRDQKVMACEILTRIIHSMPAGQALNRYEDMFLEGLVHPEDLVKELIIQELQTAASSPEVSHQLSSKIELVLSCLRLVGSDDLNISGRALKVLTTLATQGDAANILVSPPLVEEMRTIAAKNDTVRYRIYDIIIALCCSSENKLAITNEARLIQPLLEEVSTGDILIQLNALELLRNLAAVQHGRDYLKNEGMIQKLANSLNESTSDPLGSLIVPGFLKFFGTLAHFQPSVLSEYPNFTGTLFNLIGDSDILVAVVAMETISFISTGIDGKLALSQQGSQMDDSVKRIGALLNQSTGDIRKKTLHCIAEMLHVPSNQLNDERVLGIVEHWFYQLDSKPITLIMNVVKQPFSDIRMGALNIFLQLSPQPWAQKIMSNQPGFLEFLIDRRSEPDKECLERKYEIVKSISESAVEDAWTPYGLAQMRDHVREGPWFVHGQSAVAFESGP